MTSRIAKNLTVASMDGSTEHMCLPIVECDEIPNNRNEIATPAIARTFQHLSEIACHIPELDPQAKILLLIGRDLIVAHHVLDQRISHDAPYAQKLSLGWTIIGETYLNKAHLPANVSVDKTYLHDNGRPSILLPCNNSQLRFLISTRKSCPLCSRERQMTKSQDLLRKILFSWILWKVSSIAAQKGNGLLPYPFCLDDPDFQTFTVKQLREPEIWIPLSGRIPQKWIMP